MGAFLLLLQSPSRADSVRLGGEIVEVAKGFLHVREVGKNRGQYVDYFNRTVGVPLGSAWCMAFAYTAWKIAYNEQGLQSPLHRTGSVARQLKFALQVGSGLRVIRVRNVGAVAQLRAGDLLLAKSGTSSEKDIGRIWLGHVGIYTGLQSNERLQTIEGNTSGNSRGSQREGNGVFLKYRQKKFWLAGVQDA